MKKNVLSLFCSLALTVLLMTSCAKEGPAGAQGPAGPAGPTGAAGAAGAAGIAGTANVIYSAWLDVGFSDTTFVSGGASQTFYYTYITAPKLTNAILNTGEVKVYINLNTSTQPEIFPLPYNSPAGDYIQPLFFSGGIELTANDDFGTFQSNNVKYYQYRYILIPGGVPARSSIDWNNYADVKEKLNLPD